MLCSECKKNAAILFYNKVENGKETMEGLCYDCAKKKGINPLDVLSKQSDLLNKDKINLNDMSKQLETVFKDFLPCLFDLCSCICADRYYGSIHVRMRQQKTGRGIQC